MGLASVIRKGVAILDKQTTDLQEPVEYHAWEGIGDYGEAEYAAAVMIPAIVEEKQMLRRMADGSEIAQKASITIPRPIRPNGAANRREPVDPRDKFILPNGFTGPILYVNGVIDPSTNAPYSYEIVLG